MVLVKDIMLVTPEAIEILALPDPADKIRFLPVVPILAVAKRIVKFEETFASNVRLRMVRLDPRKEAELDVEFALAELNVRSVELLNEGADDQLVDVAQFPAPAPVQVWARPRCGVR